MLDVNNVQNNEYGNIKILEFFKISCEGDDSNLIKIISKQQHYKVMHEISDFGFRFVTSSDFPLLFLSYGPYGHPFMTKFSNLIYLFKHEYSKHF